MAGSGIWRTFSYRDNGSVGAYTDISSFHMTDAAVEHAPGDTVDTAAQVGVERGALKRISFTGLDYAAFAALNTKMVSRTLLDTKITYMGGATRTIKPVRFIVFPVLSMLQDVAEVFLGDSAATGDPNSNAPDWTSVGAILGDSNPDLSPLQDTDGLGRPWFDGVQLSQEFILPEVSAGTIAAFHLIQGSKLAIKRPNSQYTIYSNLVPQVLTASEDARRTKSIRLRVVGSEAAWGDLVSFTDGDGSATTPGKWFEGFRFEGTAMAYAESTIQTDA